MADPAGPAARLIRWRAPAFASVAVVAVATVVLAAMGQRWWCKCAQPDIASWDVWSMHNSQHVMDPYALSHVLHGVVFYGVLVWVLRGERARWMLPVALVLEAAWEVLENTPLVINRYREATASLDYFGDSVTNSVADIIACAVGFGLAAAVPWWGSVLVFIGFELLMVAWIRDSLILNVIMLAHPIEAIKNWQMAISP